MIFITIAIENDADMPEELDGQLAALLTGMGLKGRVDNGQTCSSTSFGEEVSPMQEDLWLKDL